MKDLAEKPYDVDDMRMAVDTLRKGGVILYPTDTVWGLGCDATNAAAVEKVFAIKHRPDNKSMLVLVDSTDRAKMYADGLTDVACDLMEMSDKPLTLVIDGAKNIDKKLVADDGSVGIRVTREKFSHDLCYRLGRPIVSTSVNISSQPAAKVFADISPEMLETVDYVVKYRQGDKRQSKPSSIIKLKADGQITIIRQ